MHVIQVSDLIAAFCLVAVEKNHSLFFFIREDISDNNFGATFQNEVRTDGDVFCFDHGKR